MHTAPGACLLYTPGAVCFSYMVLEHVLEYSSGLVMVQDHKVLRVNTVSRGQNLKKAM